MIGQVKTKDGQKIVVPISGSIPVGNPVGTLLSRANGQVPRNYLECNGSTFNAGQYPALYLYLGTNVLPERFDHSQPSAIETIVPSTTTITEVTALYDGILWLLSDSIISGRKVTINGVEYNPLSTAAMSNVTISVRKGDVVSISGSTSTNNYIVQAFWFKKHLYIKAVDGVDISDEDAFLDTVKNFVEEKNSYSTEETLTGGKWIDGKPIYRKVYNVNISTIVSGWVNTDISVTGIDTITKADFLSGGVPVNGLVQLTQKSNNTLRLFTTNAWSISTITIEYTKTTD